MNREFHSTIRKEIFSFSRRVCHSRCSFPRCRRNRSHECLFPDRWWNQATGCTRGSTLGYGQIVPEKSKNRLNRMSSSNVSLEASRQSRVLAGTRDGVKTLTMQHARVTFISVSLLPPFSLLSSNRQSVRITLGMRF